MKESESIRDIRKGNVSKRRNPLIADLFRRIQMVEAWGRGMPLILQNEPSAKFKVIAKIFIASFDRPSFVEEISLASGKTIPAEAQVEAQPEFSTGSVPVQFQSLEDRILNILVDGALPVSILSQRLGQKRVSGQLKVVLNKLLSKSCVEFTIPDKPSSRLQKYRLTEKGLSLLESLKDEGRSLR